jgi:hypothetical protein
MVSSARQLTVIVLNICTISGTLLLMFKAQRQVRPRCDAVEPV